MKKFIAIILSAAALACGAAGLAACKKRTPAATTDPVYVSVTGANINSDGELILSYSDGTTQNLGKVKGENGTNGSNGQNGNDGKGISSAKINSAGELVITYTDGTIQYLGKVKGEDGEDGEDGVAFSCEHPQYSEWNTEIEAGCTSVGVSLRECLTCGNTDYKFTPANGHDWSGEEFEIIPVTCTQSGIKVVGCANCNATTTVTVPALSHSYENGACTLCGRSEYEDYFYYKLNTERNGYSIRLTSDKYATKGVIHIPAEHDGLPVTEISRLAFSNYINITEIIIPESVQKIGAYAFQRCSSLKSLTIPKSVTEIESINGRTTFLLSSGSIESLTVKQGNPTYHSNGNCIIETAGKTLLAGCKNSVIPTDGSVTKISSCAFYGLDFESFTIPEGVETVAARAFMSCRFGTLNISSTVNNIVSSAFKWGTKGIDNINVATGNKRYSSAGNCLIDLNEKTLLIGCNTTVIPADGSVTKIWEDAFRGCNEMTSVIIPEGVTEIGSYAFSLCSNLTSVTLPESLKIIRRNAFYNSSKLAEINLPDGVEYIGEDAFIYTAYYNNEENWQDGSLYMGKHLIDVNRDVGGKLVIKEGTRTIAHSACRFTNIESVQIPESVTFIGDYVFASCDSLTEVVIPDSITSIGDYAFAFCDNLNKIVIPDSVTSIGRYAFYSCESLSEVIIPDSVTSIGYYAFAYCSNIKSVVIGSAVEIIDEGAFGGTTHEDRTIEFKDKNGWVRRNNADEEFEVSVETLNDPYAVSELFKEHYTSTGGVFSYYYVWYKANGSTTQAD